MKTIIFIICSLIGLTANAQVNWVATYGALSSSDYPMVMVNINERPAVLGKNAEYFNFAGTTINSLAYIAVFDTAGNEFLGANVFGGVDAGVTDDDGNVYLIGVHNTSGNFNPYLAAYDASGAQLWIDTLIDWQFDTHLSGICLTTSGEIWTSNLANDSTRLRSYNSATGALNWERYYPRYNYLVQAKPTWIGNYVEIENHVYAVGSRRLNEADTGAIMKFNLNGDVIDHEQFTGDWILIDWTAQDQSSGNAYTVAFAFKHEFKYQNTTIQAATSSDFASTAIVKVDTNLNYLYHTVIEDSKNSFQINGHLVEDDGSVIITGVLDTAIIVDGTPIFSMDDVYHKAFIMKFDNELNLLWYYVLNLSSVGYSILEIDNQLFWSGKINTVSDTYDFGPGHIIIVAHEDVFTCKLNEASLFLGLDEPVSKDRYSFYPNPIGQGQLITLEGASLDCEVRLVDITGKSIMQSTGITQLRLPSSLMAGVYTLLITDYGHTEAMKIVIE